MITSPYYIYAPKYQSNSAGRLVLYKLYDELKNKGFEVYSILKTPCNLDIPRLTNKIINDHFKEKRQPITVYPETTLGNPLCAEFTVRYLLCHNSYFGPDLKNHITNLTYFYSKELIYDNTMPPNILFIPVVNQSIFYKLKKEQKRSGSCYAALKYKYIFNQKVFDLPDNCIEITRGLKNSQTPNEITQLFRSKEYFYCFDNSALALEATLCGCIAILMPNPYLKSAIARTELNDLPGIAWGNTKEEIQKAKETIYLSEENYKKAIALSEKQLNKFITNTQDKAKEKPYNRKVKLKPIDRLVFKDHRPLWFKILIILNIHKIYNRTLSIPVIGKIFLNIKTRFIDKKTAVRIQERLNNR